MALIKCQECGKEISNKAKKCPNCGYVEAKESKEKNNYKKKNIFISIIIACVIIAAIIIIVIVITNKKDNSDEKLDFTDIALSTAKAAETAYVDNLESGNKAYTVSYLRKNYIKSLNSNFEGCIIVKADEDGNITGKTIYLTDGKYMTKGASSDDIMKNYELLVDKIDSSNESMVWKADYNNCKFNKEGMFDSIDENKPSVEEEKTENETKEEEKENNNKTENKTNNQNSNTETKKSTNSNNNSTNNSSNESISAGKKNALKSAKDYLKFSAFSRKGLIEQLEFEKYTTEEASYAVDNCGADWNEQALKSAKSYLKVSAFSYKGLKEQLEFEGFTSSQASYGVNNCGANWNEQASKAAKAYLNISSFSRNGLIDQLEFEGFTHEQAVYGVDQAGL